MSAAASAEPGALRRSWSLDGLEIAISLGGVSRPDEWRRTLAWVERAETLGLHSVWLPEMHFASGASTSPLLTLAAFAARTRRLRLGTTSLLLPIHHPLRLAEEVAALERLSRGRVLLGLGRGFRAKLFEAFGVDASSKRDRFDAALDLILDAWAGLPVTLSGTSFAAGENPPAPASVLPSRAPPLAVAAFGRKGLLQAARRSLPYLASPLEPFSLVEENLRFHRDSLPADTDAAELPVIVMRTVHVADDDLEAARVFAALEAETRAISGRVPAALARAAAAPTHERVIVGTRNEVYDAIDRHRERLGLDLLIARPQLGGTTQRQRERSLELLASDILPGLRAARETARQAHTVECG